MKGVDAVPIFLVTILYRSEESIPGFLNCLRSQEVTNWHLAAIDNASPDGSAAAVSAAADSRITIIRNKGNLGFAKAANQGLRAAIAAGAEFMVLINNDVWFGPDFLGRLLQARAELEADVIAPRI